jgi:hypothetical protein
MYFFKHQPFHMMLPYSQFPTIPNEERYSSNDTRTFQPGESVFLRDGYFLKGTYVSPVVCPDNDLVYVHRIRSNGFERWVNWLMVGKRCYSVSPTLFKKVLEERMPWCDPNAIESWVREGY